MESEGVASTVELASACDRGNTKGTGRALAALRQLGYVEALGISREYTVWRITAAGAILASDLPPAASRTLPSG
jgi:hypothetical protein